VNTVIFGPSLRSTCIQSGESLIFLSQRVYTPCNEDQKSEENNNRGGSSTNVNVLSLNAYNVVKQTLQSQVVDTGAYRIDMASSSCALDATSKRMYIITANLHLYVISIDAANEHLQLTLLDTLNEFDESSMLDNNIKPGQLANAPVLSVLDNHALVIVGGASSQQTAINAGNRLYVPYTLMSSIGGSQELAIRNFGRRCHIECICEHAKYRYLLLFGGESNVSKHVHASTNALHPDATMYQVRLGLQDDDEPYEWQESCLSLPRAMHSFGVVHLDFATYRYIVLFGGTRVLPKEKNSRPEQSQSMYALYLDKRYECLSKEKLTQIEQSKSTPKSEQAQRELMQLRLHGMWLKLPYSLPTKANCDAFYDAKIDAQKIHLLTHDGLHWVLPAQPLRGLLSDREHVLTYNHQKGEFEDGTCIAASRWTTKVATSLKKKTKKTKNGNMDKNEESDTVSGEEKEKEKEKTEETVQYICEYVNCRRAFTHKAGLKRHTDVVHLGKMIYSDDEDDDDEDDEDDIGKNPLPTKVKVKRNGPRNIMQRTTGKIVKFKARAKTKQ